jgi:hypothetical protein
MVCLLLWQPSQVLLYYILLKQHIYGFSIDKCKDSGFYPLHQTSGLKKVKLAIISDHPIEVQHFNNSTICVVCWGISHFSQGIPWLFQKQPLPLHGFLRDNE